MLPEELIDSQIQLQDFLNHNSSHQGTAELPIALDTEFVRVSTYFPKLCLIQIGTAEGIVLIDTLTIDDLAPLWNWLTKQPSIAIHAASQDLEVLRLNGCPRLTPLFDTQIAAGLCGYASQMGYAALAKQLLDVDIDKGMTRFDWRTRPLPTKARQYAADDVRYLPQIATKLEAELTALGRNDWLQEDCQHLLDADANVISNDEQWRRVRGIAKHDVHAQSRAKALASWREQRAHDKNKPRGWILKDQDLLAMAISGKSTNAHLQKLMDTAPPLPHPEYLIAQSVLNSAEKQRLEALKLQLESAAHELDIEPSLIANRKQLEQWAREARPQKLCNGWRKTVCDFTS